MVPLPAPRRRGTLTFLVCATLAEVVSMAAGRCVAEPPAAHAVADALRSVEGSPADLFAACGLPQPTEGTNPSWAWWCGWPAPPPSAAMEHPGEWQPVASKCDTRELSPFAVRGGDTVLVFLTNGSNEPVRFALRVRLPSGAYTVDCLTFAPKDAETLPKVDGLESVVLGGTGFAWKMGTLRAGFAAIYRFTNRSTSVQRAFRAVMDALGTELPRSRGPCRRIMGALRECGDHVALLGHVSPTAKDVAVRAVDRALLLLGQAQALFRNFRDNGRLSAGGAGPIGTALDELEQALAQTATACLNVVPEMTVEDPGEEHVRTITITTANAGRRSLSFVKLGVGAPPGSRVWPAEEATVSALAPGQSASAQFRVRFHGPVMLNAIQGSITYVALRTPIHLWIRNYWPPGEAEPLRSGYRNGAPTVTYGKGGQ